MEDVTPKTTTAGPKPWVVSEGWVLSSFFYKNKLTQSHLRDPAVMPKATAVPEILRAKVIERISPAGASLTRSEERRVGKECRL